MSHLDIFEMAVGCSNMDLYLNIQNDYGNINVDSNKMFHCLHILCNFF